MQDGLTVFDWIIITITFCSMFISLIRGFIKEVLSIVTLVAAIYCATKFNAVVSNLIPIITTEIIKSFIAGGLIILLILLVGSIINASISKIIKIGGLGFMNHILGAILGGLKALSIVALIVTMLAPTPISTQNFWTKSLTIPPLVAIGHYIGSKLPEDLGNIINLDKKNKNVNNNKGSGL